MGGGGAGAGGQGGRGRGGGAVMGTCYTTLRASLSGTFLQRKDVVNQCLEFAVSHVSDRPAVAEVNL